MADITLETVKNWFESAEDMTLEAREVAEQCRDYYDNKQWSDTELAALQNRNQPPVTKNRIKPKVDFLLGMERQTRTDPAASPRNPQDIEGAQAATDAIRYVCDVNVYDQERSLVFENLLIEGTGGFDCTVSQGQDGKTEIKVSHVPWDRIWYDPFSRRPDFRDAKYYGWVVWMDFDDAVSMWPDAADVFEQAISTSSMSDTYDDAPRDKWADSKRKRVRVVGAWYKSNGDWHHCIITGAGFVESPEPSPWRNTDGTTEPGMLLRSSFVDRQNNRYGVVMPLLSIQDAINYRESKALHTLSVRQTWATSNTGLDAATVKKELAKPDGHIELHSGVFGQNFGILNTSDLATGQFTLLQEAKSEIDNMGSAAALSGKGGASSGRELIARQQGGKMELAGVFDGLRMLNHAVYRWIWGRIQQFWTAPMMIRVTDDQKNAKFVEINKRVTVRDILAAQGVQIPPMMQGDPRLDQVIVQNNVATLDIDITVDEAPDTTTLVGEQFQQLTELYRVNPQAIPFRLLIEASDFRNKQRLLEIMDQQEEQAQQAAAQAQQTAQAAMQLELQSKASDIENTQADTEKKRSEAAENIQQIQQRTFETVAKQMPAVLTGML